MDDKKYKIIRYVVSYLIVAFIAFLIYYLTLPAINLQSPGFWVFLTVIILLAILPVKLDFNNVLDRLTGKKEFYIGKKGWKIKGDKKPLKWLSDNKFTVIVLVPMVILIVGTALSSTLFNARKYASVITVTEGVFEEDMPESTTVTNIALMDSDSARIVGKRALGSLADVVSQYEISDTYNQINYKGAPQKVAPLEYADFFKWIGNRKNGIPGYVIVDPVNFDSKYVELSTPLKYAQSGYLGDDLNRKLRFLYPTKILGEPKFEITEEGKPVYIVPCYKPRVFMFGAKDINEVIIFDPCTGESQLKAVGDIPAWVDIVYDGYLASEKYNWHGTLSGGFFNSVIGNVGCKITTDDFGYIALNDDVWYFTGVTSVTSDQSNIGFILSNARTGEYKYYPVIGAEEYSAMGAAEGEVQEKGYKASFPSLVNIAGEATYIMVLTDNNGLPKLYALVNVEQYYIVATATDQAQAMTEYKKLLSENGVISGEGSNSDAKEFTVLSITSTVINGNTVLFFEGQLEEESVYFKIDISQDESALFIRVGDKLKVNAFETETDNIYQIYSWTKIG